MFIEIKQEYINYQPSSGCSVVRVNDIPPFLLNLNQCTTIKRSINSRVGGFLLLFDCGDKDGVPCIEFRTSRELDEEYHNLLKKLNI